MTSIVDEDDPEMGILAELARKLMEIQSEGQALDDEIISLSESDEYKEAIRNERDIHGPVTKVVKDDVDSASGMVYHLKKSVPEGHIEDPMLHKYLSVARLTESVAELTEHRTRSEKYLQFLQEKHQYNANMSTEIRNLREATKIQHQHPVGLDGEKNAANGKKELQSKIREFIKSYKTIKTFLGELLVQISPEQNEGEGSLLAHLLQALWTLSFSASGPDAYLTLSQFAQRVEPRDVNLLVTNEIVERDPDNPDRVRMINFVDNL